MNKERLLPLSAALLGGLIIPGIISEFLLASDDQAVRQASAFVRMFPLLVIALGIFGRQALLCRSWRPLAGALQGLLAGAISGLLVGIAMRLAMRGVALAAGRQPHFSVGGTMLIVGGTAAMGAFFGAFIAAVRRWSTRVRIRDALCFGGVLLALFWFPFFRVARGDLKGVVDPLMVGVATTAVSTLWVLYALVVIILLERWERRSPAGFVEAKSVTAPL